MKHREVEIKRVEKVNEYEVTIINRLIEYQKLFSDGKVYSKEYSWKQDMIQPDGHKSTRQMASYKRLSSMEKSMEKYNFEMN